MVGYPCSLSLYLCELCPSAERQVSSPLNRSDPRSTAHQSILISKDNQRFVIVEDKKKKRESGRGDVNQIKKRGGEGKRYIIILNDLFD